MNAEPPVARFHMEHHVHGSREEEGRLEKAVSEELSGVEFTHRWSLHILPKGVTKSRCFGGYSSANLTAFICRAPVVSIKSLPSSLTLR